MNRTTVSFNTSSQQGVQSDGSRTHTTNRKGLYLAFHNDIKDIILSEVKEQEESMIEFNEKNDNLKHIQHYPVLENDIKHGRFRNWWNNTEIYAEKFKIYIPNSQITDSWFNVSNTGGFHQHYHANSLISGVYYVTCSDPTSFTKDERTLCHMPVLNILKTKDTEFNQNDVIYAKEVN